MASSLSGSGPRISYYDEMQQSPTHAQEMVQAFGKDPVPGIVRIYGDAVENPDAFVTSFLRAGAFIGQMVAQGQGSQQGDVAGAFTAVSSLTSLDQNLIAILSSVDADTMKKAALAYTRFFQEIGTGEFLKEVGLPEGKTVEQAAKEIRAEEGRFLSTLSKTEQALINRCTTAADFAGRVIPHVIAEIEGNPLQEPILVTNQPAAGPFDPTTARVPSVEAMARLAYVGKIFAACVARVVAVQERADRCLADSMENMKVSE